MNIKEKQHDYPVDLHGYGEEKAEQLFHKQQEHDRRKKEYALNNHYNFLEIWYYDYDKIEYILENNICIKEVNKCVV